MRLLLCLILAVPLFAQSSYTMSPSRGFAGGGTDVTISGSFHWLQVPYRVLFGSAEATLLGGSDQHLLVRTPPHLHSLVPVTIFEGQTRINTGLTFSFEGTSPDFERLLLPVFVNIEGAFGSAFRTDLTAANIGTTPLPIYGLQIPCVVSACLDPDLADEPYELSATPEFGPLHVELTGNPGRFVYVRPGDLDHLALNLRAYDTSRAAENFGTEVPIVREAEFETSEFAIVTLTGIPTDPRFRNTLRIYSPDNRELTLYMTGTGITPRQHTIALRPGANIFQPSYAQFSDFPVGVGEVKVQIQASHIILSPPVSYSIWAFVSVTNNETQHITTITPQP